MSDTIIGIIVLAVWVVLAVILTAIWWREASREAAWWDGWEAGYAAARMMTTGKSSPREDHFAARHRAARDNREKQPRLSDLVFVPFSVRTRIQEAIDQAPQGRQADVAAKLVLDHLRPELDRLQNAITQPLADRDGLQNGGT